MLRRFFIWRAERKMDLNQYRFDKRQYKGVFKPGFFAHLNDTKFWQADNDPFERSKKRRKRVFWVVVTIILGVLVWAAIESSHALSIF